MSRLSNYRKKEVSKEIYLLIGVLILLAILFFSFGFKLLIQTSIYINSLFSKQSTNQQDDGEEFYGTLQVDEPPTATNSTKIIVSGSVSNYPLVEIYINGDKVKSVSLNNKTEFNREVGDLQKGTNELYVKAVSKEHKKSKKSEVYSILYKSEKPKLEINEPADKSTTNKQEVKLTGKTDKDTSVSVNNGPVVVDINGNFSTTLRLHDGDNAFEIIAEDLAGNVEKKTLTVTYRKDE